MNLFRKVKKQDYGVINYTAVDLEMKCPSCNFSVFFDLPCFDDETGILVKCETEGKVNIDGFAEFSEGCSNPICEWSKLKREQL